MLGVRAEETTVTKKLSKFEFIRKSSSLIPFPGMRESIGEYKMVYIFLEAQLSTSSTMIWNL